MASYRLLSTKKIDISRMADISETVEKENVSVRTCFSILTFYLITELLNTF